MNLITGNIRVEMSFIFKTQLTHKHVSLYCITSLLVYISIQHGTDYMYAGTKLVYILIYVYFKSLHFVIWIFTRLKLCLADAIHNFKWVKIIQIWQNEGQRFWNLANWFHIHIWHVQKMAFKVLIKNKKPNKFEVDGLLVTYQASHGSNPKEWIRCRPSRRSVVLQWYKMFLPHPLVQIQYCGEPPWGRVLDLR